MSVLILNRVPYCKAPYDKWLNTLDDDIVFLTSQETYSQYYGKFKEIISFEDYLNNGNVVKSAIELHDEYPYTKIVAISEFDLLRAAEIREFLGVAGQSYESAKTFRDKALMKQTVIESNDFKVPKYKAVERVTDILQFINKNGYPTVIKPLDGSGTVNTIIINNREDLERFLIKNNIDNTIIEEYIEGDMYHIDGLIIDKEIVFSWPSKYHGRHFDFMDGASFIGSYILEDRNPMVKRLKDISDKILKQFPLPKFTTFHLEVFHTKNDEIYFCEVASRTGGTRISEVLEKSFGINITKLWVQYQCGVKNLDIKKNKSNVKKFTGWLLIPPKEGKICSLPTMSSPDSVLDYQLNCKVGDEFYGVLNSVDSIASLLIHGESENDLKNNIEKSAQWFMENTRWL